MIKRRSIIGLCVLCACAFSAFAVQSAAAASNGTTAFTCKAVTPAGGTAGFSKEHCKATDAVSSEAKFEHFAIPANTTTKITGGNTTTKNAEGVFETEPAFLTSTQAGVKEKLKATIVEKDPESAAWMENRQDPTTGEHYIIGEGNLTYTNVTVVEPAEKGCKVKNERVTTQKLRATTKGQGDAIKFEPAPKIEEEKEIPQTLFAEFEIEGCSVGALNGTYKVEGSLIAEVDGATIRTVESKITEQKTLKTRGQTSGLEGVLTIRGTAKEGEAEDTALSSTTVATP
jgi:hypothetical protein